MGNVTYIPNPLLEEEWEASALALALVAEIGEDVRTEAKRLAPKDTGALEASINAEPEVVEGHPGVAVFATVRYAGYVETGTFDTAPQPYLRPALDTLGRR